MAYPIDQTSSQIHEINFQGNIIPASWKNHIRHNERPDLNSMYILSEILYWYRPIVCRDEFGNEVLKKKYKSDLLQKGYKQLIESTGLSEKQIREALERLEKLGLIKRHTRTIESHIKDSTEIRKIPNILFIEIFPERIKEITFTSLKKEVTSLPPGNHTPSREGTTYTETKPKTNFAFFKGNDLVNDSVDDKSMPFIEKKNEGNAKQRFPLRKEQQPFLERMLSLDMNEPESKLIQIIRKYTQDEKGVKLLNSAISHLEHEISKKTVFKKPRLAMFNAVLSGKISPVCPQVRENRKSAEEAKSHHNWHSLRIEEKYIICDYSKKEISLNQDSIEFLDQLISLFKLSNLY